MIHVKGNVARGKEFYFLEYCYIRNISKNYNKAFQYFSKDKICKMNTKGRLMFIVGKKNNLKFDYKTGTLVRQKHSIDHNFPAVSIRIHSLCRIRVWGLVISNWCQVPENQSVVNFP